MGRGPRRFVPGPRPTLESRDQDLRPVVGRPDLLLRVLPPKSDQEQLVLSRTLAELQPLGPSFVSVTYRGGAESRQRTQNLVTGMLHTSTLVPMAHLVCVAHSRLELAEILVSLRRAGIENVLALGRRPGPRPRRRRPGSSPTPSSWSSWPGRSAGSRSGWRPTRPATRPRPTWRADRDRLAEKLALADFAITQFFFEADEYLGLVAELAERGIDKPVLPGIMPVTGLSSIPRMAGMGAAVPDWMVARLEAADATGGREAVRQCGVELATELCRAVLAGGAPGLHFYTLNRSSATRDIYTALGLAPDAERAPTA